MKWLDKLERKFGRFAIRNLMLVITSLNLAVFLLMFLDKEDKVLGNLALIPELVMEGQVWRLLTYIFIPPNFSPLWIIFTLYFYYMIGTNLEREWGSFRLNIYYLLGMIGTTVAGFITGGFTTSVYLNLSLFLAFARLYPNYEILLFFVLPVKVKFLAWVNFAFIGYTVLFDPIYLKVAALVSLLNYFVFFGVEIVKNIKQKRRIQSNRKRFLREVREAERNKRY